MIMLLSRLSKKHLNLSPVNIVSFIYTALEQAGIPFQCFPFLQTNKVLDIEEASEAIPQALDQASSVSGIILGLLLLLKFLKNMK